MKKTIKVLNWKECVSLGAVVTMRHNLIADCMNNNFECEDGTQVVTRSRYCDGKVDCDDGSDEPQECSKFTHDSIATSLAMGIDDQPPVFPGNQYLSG